MIFNCKSKREQYIRKSFSLVFLTFYLYILILRMALNLSQQTIELQHIITKYPDPSEFSFEQAAKYYQIFVDVVSDHNHRYYIDANPIISDYEYDQLFTYLKQLEEFFPSLISNNSPTQALIAQISEGFRKAQHRIPLLSLENSYSATDIYAW